MKGKKQNKNIVKYIVIALIVLIIVISSFMIYKNVFAGSNSNRYEGIENYKLTKDEISNAKEKLEEIGNIDSINIYTTSKIIKIFVKLKEDVDFEVVKNISNQTIEKFSENNLSYYDVEIFIDSNNSESSVYPQIGYKYKLGKEFAW